MCCGPLKRGVGSSGAPKLATPLPCAVGGNAMEAVTVLVTGTTAARDTKKEEKTDTEEKTLSWFSMKEGEFEREYTSRSRKAKSFLSGGQGERERERKKAVPEVPLCSFLFFLNMTGHELWHPQPARSTAGKHEAHGSLSAQQHTEAQCQGKQQKQLLPALDHGVQSLIRGAFTHQRCCGPPTRAGHTHRRCCEPPTQAHSPTLL